MRREAFRAFLRGTRIKIPPAPYLVQAIMAGSSWGVVMIGWHLRVKLEMNGWLVLGGKDDQHFFIKDLTILLVSYTQDGTVDRKELDRVSKITGITL